MGVHTISVHSESSLHYAVSYRWVWVGDRTVTESRKTSSRRAKLIG